MALAVLEKSPLKVKVPAQRTANRKYASRSPAPLGGPKLLSPRNQRTFPLRRSKTSQLWWPANEAWRVLSLTSRRGPGRAQGRGRGAMVGSKVTARTTWAGDSVLPAAAAASRALGLVAWRAVRTAEPDAGSRRHGHQNGRTAGGRPDRQRPGTQLAGWWQGTAGRGR